MTRFHKQDLTGARFEEIDFTRAFFRNVYFVDAKLRGAWLENVEIDGEIRGLTINGVDVGPLVEAELDRMHPERVLLRSTDAAGMREAWAMVEGAWPATVERARRLPPELLDERVDDEWSFIETLRHLLFATDAWVLRAYLGREDPYSPYGILHTEHERGPGDPPDTSQLRPSLDEVLTFREDRLSTVRGVFAELTDEILNGDDVELTTPGYPPPGRYPVRRCLRAVINEEWLHRGYAERDLAVLEASS